jgi:hypothetical protein
MLPSKRKTTGAPIAPPRPVKSRTLGKSHERTCTTQEHTKGNVSRLYSAGRGAIGAGKEGSDKKELNNIALNAPQRRPAATDATGARGAKPDGDATPRPTTHAAASRGVYRQHWDCTASAVQDLHGIVRPLPSRHRAVLDAWLDANAESLIGEIARCLLPLVQHALAELDVLGMASSLRGRCVEIGPSWALALTEEEVVVLGARVHSTMFDAFAALTVDAGDLPQPCLDEGVQASIASALANALLGELP